MNIPPLGPAANYEATQPAQTSAIAQGKPVLNIQDMPLALPSPESLESETASFAESVGRMFREAGIEVPPEPVLTSDYEGRVRVSNEHPDKGRIEYLFKDRPEMQQSFARISSWSSLQRAAEHFKFFAAEYERLQGEPDVLRALVETEIARNKAPFYMAVREKGIETFFGNLVDVKA